MKKSVTLVIVLLSIAIYFSNCKHEVPPKEDPPKEVVDTTDYSVTLSDTCSFDTIYFVTEILPIFETYCAVSGCHNAASAADGIILDNYKNIITTGEIEAGKPDAGDILEVLNETDPEKVMPPGGRLTPEQINAIRVWINQGAKNNSCRNKCFADSFSFSREIWPIVEGSCRGCHRGPNASGGIRYNNYSDIKAGVDDGSFLGSILHQPGYKAMPLGGKLDSCATAKIENWIKAGAPNN